ncbi:hypothetical protein GOQ27_10995 [Clostridium sp. D2Q-11]|uniref:Uncharacterized protein n=1 Tax=Anaeromonas frigoriresistens TaxID=2683708 RepID=A0A942V0L8_9FIRM|nr:hypothetical protein [Anaeromonas frigoriresistens]MBS4538992.1 hypothetical protein [Anaeromonas frigoriresistens]
MAGNKYIIRIAILSWTRFKYRLSESKKDEDNIEDNIKDIENYLSTQEVEDLNIIYKSPDYYIIRYLFQGNTEILQYDTREVEGILY